MANAVVSGGGRAAAMAARLDDTARRLGVDATGRQEIASAFDAAMEPRIRAGLNDHHPDFLHPARNALILMDDAGIAEPGVLAAAILTESRDPALSPDPELARRAGSDAGALVQEVVALGQGDEGSLLERLVLASDSARLIAIAERLDHARHLHLRDPAEWAGYHALTCDAFAPAAARAHPTLQRRLAWWCRTFGKRLGASS